MVMSVMPELTNSRTVCSMTGLSPTGSIPWGWPLVSGSSSRGPDARSGDDGPLMVGDMPPSSTDGRSGVSGTGEPADIADGRGQNVGHGVRNIMSPPWQVPATIRPH